MSIVKRAIVAADAVFALFLKKASKVFALGIHGVLVQILSFINVQIKDNETTNAGLTFFVKLVSF